MDKFVDLHIHTSYSDGVLTPEMAVQYAAKVNLSAISITDHDITDGIEPAIKEGEKLGIEVIPGIELSAQITTPIESEMHILGYYINYKSSTFQEALDLFRKTRHKRAITILDKLEEIDIKLERDKIMSNSEKGAIGRLHIAKALINQGFVSGIAEAFYKYLGYNKPAYVPKLKLKPKEAIKMILKAGGIPVIAHPFYNKHLNLNSIKGLITAGLMGLEVWHIKHPAYAVRKFTEIADKYGILKTGGSDCHGEAMDKMPLMGKVKVPYSVVEDLKRCKKELDSKNTNILK